MESNTAHAALTLSDSEHAFLAELLEREEAKLLVEIRHTDNRHFREELNRRLDVVSGLSVRVKNLRTAAAGHKVF